MALLNSSFVKSSLMPSISVILVGEFIIGNFYFVILQRYAFLACFLRKKTKRRIFEHKGAPFFRRCGLAPRGNG
jgi:hypothetical protein